jgi:hypothetical protein
MKFLKRLFGRTTRFIAGVLLYLTAVTSMAQSNNSYPRDIVLSWTNASLYTDDTPIEVGDLTGVKVDCYRGTATVPTLSTIVVPTGKGMAQTQTFVGAIPNSGTYRCEAFSIVIGDIYSLASNSVSKKYVGTPKSITTLKFE